MPDRTTAIATAFELGLLLAGSILLWRFALSPAARLGKMPPALPRWNAPLTDFLLFLWLVCSGGFAGSLAAGSFLKAHPLSSDEVAALATAAGQFGILGGLAVFNIWFDRHRAPPAHSKENVFWSGIVTFLIAMPVVTVTSLVWQALLELGGLPAEKQDLIRMFLEVKSPWLLAVMIILACVGAPLVEELIFRAGIFRFARTRLPRWAALLVPACLFGLLHQNLASFAPLVVLGVLFSLAYERTGRIGTSMIAHGLFNLNSLILILAGIET